MEVYTCASFNQWRLTYNFVPQTYVESGVLLYKFVASQYLSSRPIGGQSFKCDWKIDKKHPYRYGSQILECDWKITKIIALMSRVDKELKRYIIILATYNGIKNF